jgi:hypothetical protein
MDKALVALILSVLQIVDWVFGQGWFGHVTEETLGVIISVFTPLLVWLVPNRRS